MKISRAVEYTFFFGLLLLAGYMVWLITAPFIAALALSVIIVTICHPVYLRIRNRMPRKSKNLAAFISTMMVLVVIVIPLILISSLIVREIVSFYQDISSGNLQIQNNIEVLENKISSILPGFEFDLSEQILSSVEWLAGNIGAIFAGTLSTIFAFVIALVGSFYFFRDGKELLQVVVKVSPLPDNEDQIIFERLAKAIRAVATGTVLVAIIQGSLAAIGFSLFGLGERAILWGCLAAVGALIPGVGTGIVTVPAAIYLMSTGDLVNGVGLFVWSMMVVGTIDNFVGPYLISRGNNLHPFIILISVLGGMSLVGPIGFVLGPVMVTLFVVLLEIYSQYIIKEIPIEKTDDII